ncbi:MAG: transketolase [Spirochaetaceae bacterium]|nr:MAG: transketolase [Spirochaetaceae bacterium]
MRRADRADKREDVVREIAERARRMRIHVIRMTTQAGSGHVTSSFSAADIVATLYFREMRYDSKNMEDPDRDRFILSKGHAAPILYAALHEAGVFDESTILSLRQPGSILQGHPWVRTPGVDATSGSLGIGLSQAIGRAIGARMRNSPSRIYVMISDGECDEGQTWESALAAAHFATDNLCLFLDRNNAQVDGSTDTVMNLEPLADKWRAFGWRVEEIDGHDYKQILDYLRRSREDKGRPSIAIARTKKGFGVSFVEEGNRYRHASVLDPEAAERAIAELESKQ